MKKIIDKNEAYELTKDCCKSVTMVLNEQYQEQIDKLQKKIDSLEQMMFKYSIKDIVVDKETYNLYEIVALIKDRKKPSYQCKYYYFYGEEPYYDKDAVFTKEQDELLFAVTPCGLANEYCGILKSKFIYGWSDEKIKEKFKRKW